jgi:exopolysaccharide biosynthesis polyprenyl glycosylphosphotransferase
MKPPSETAVALGGGRTSVPDGIRVADRATLTRTSSTEIAYTTTLAARPARSTELHPVRVEGPRAPRAVWQRRYGVALRISDFVVVASAVLIAQLLRFGTTNAGLTGLDYLGYPLVSILIVAGWVWFLTIYRTRAPGIAAAGSEEFRRVWTATLSLFGAIAIVSALFKLEFARGYLAIALPLGLLGLSANRVLARRVVTTMRRRGLLRSGVLVVGESKAVRSFARSLARHPEAGYTVVGVCAPGQFKTGVLHVAGVGRLPIFGHDRDIRPAVAASGADTVAIASTDHLGPQGIRDLTWQLENLDIDVLVSPGMIDVAGPRLTVRQVADMPLIQVAKPQYDGAKGFEKRAFDVGFSLLVLLAVLPLMLIAAAAIKLTSKGPVFYLSERIGLGGKPFRMIKFRSMVADAEQRLAELSDMNEVQGGVLFKIHCDPRITRVGRFLRRYSVDELPQFINVLRGEMSVVGPRPPLRSEVEGYDDHVRRRLLVKPGITGLWQVSGRSDLAWEDAVRLDLLYVENWSMIYDLVIAVKTAGAVWRGSGAY